MSAQPSAPEAAPHAQYDAPTNGLSHDTNALQNGNGHTSSYELDIVCGPLLNYRHQGGEGTNKTWNGSVVIVTRPGQSQPTLIVRNIGSVDASVGPDTNSNHEIRIDGERLYEDPEKGFWRFTLSLPLLQYEATWEYAFTQSSNAQPKVFVVPAANQSMRIMFHSCNGFSVGTDEDAWSGPALWNDVLRKHASKPFHVMLGGGDQIYNDNVRVTGPLKEWTDIGNPKKRRDYPFGEELRAACDKHYYDNYTRWYGQEPFKSANCIIPQVNIWDDHDIIDGFGSYTDHFMKCHVFRGIGGVAHKYYNLFQHHVAPPVSTFTTDKKSTQHEGGEPDPVQSKDTFVLKETHEDPSYIFGLKPGPYVEERSRSVYAQLGARIGFLGIDARQERTRHQINYPETYDLLFRRIEEEYSRNSELKHLIVLLGVPIAYPRLVWLENLFTSPLIAPIRLLNKRFGFAGSLFNKFDGQVDLLDDLDDHYTARQHKKERRDLINRLQTFARKHSIRVTILGGDVHLAAVGRFYSKPGLEIPAERDWRYMVNIISSAITNKPPPAAVANLLARRNKIHHLDHETDETLLEFFDKDPGHSKDSVQRAQTNGTQAPAKKTSNANHVTMPSRNYAIITESQSSVAQGQTAAAPNGIDGITANGTGVEGEPTPGQLPHTETSEHPATKGSRPNMRKPIHNGEKNAGTEHLSADGITSSGQGGPNGLDVTIRVEISNKDREGNTEGYAFTIPGLEAGGYEAAGDKW